MDPKASQSDIVNSDEAICILREVAECRTKIARQLNELMGQLERSLVKVDLVTSASPEAISFKESFRDFIFSTLCEITVIDDQLDMLGLHLSEPMIQAKSGKEGDVHQYLSQLWGSMGEIRTGLTSVCVRTDSIIHFLNVYHANVLAQLASEVSASGKS